jgi:hypothetical protein
LGSVKAVAGKKRLLIRKNLRDLCAEI